MKHKEPIDYPNNLQDIFGLLSVSGKHNVVGSANLRGILYNSDFDLGEDLKNGHDIHHSLRKIFLHKYETAKHLPSVYFTDFKCGEDANGEPLRWDYKTLIKNSNKGFTFEDALKSGGIIKLDCVAFVNGRFEEITEVYELHCGCGCSTSSPPKKNLLDDLKQSQREYLEEGNYWKALKREFSIASLHNNLSKTKRLVEFFNSVTGLLAKSVSELDTINLVLEQTFKPPNLDEIRQNLQLVKWRLSYCSSRFSKRIDAICSLEHKKAIHSRVEKLRDDIFKIVNKDAKKFRV